MYDVRIYDIITLIFVEIEVQRAGCPWYMIFARIW